MRRQLEIRYSKVDVLLNAWDLVASAIMRRASRRKDQAVMTMLQDIAILDSNPTVKRHVLLKYVNKCRELHSIAFLQWRMLYPMWSPRIESAKQVRP